MGPSPNISLPSTPQAPPPPPMFGANAEAGMRQKKNAAQNQSAFGSFLGSESTPSNTGQKTLLGQ